MTEIELRHTKIDIGIRAVGASLPFVCAGLLGYLLIRSDSVAGPAVGFIAILLVLGAWLAALMRSYLADVVHLGPAGITFASREATVPWEQIRAVVCAPGKHGLSVRGADDTELGTISYGLGRVPEAVRAIFHQLGPRAPRSEATGRTIEGSRSIGAYLPFAIVAFVPELNRIMERGVQGSTLLWSSAILAALAYGYYRNSGTRRLEISPTGLSWSSRHGEQAYHWAEIGLIGLHFRGDAGHASPSLSIALRDGSWGEFSLDGLDLAEVSALLHKHALPLWQGGFLDGKAFHAKAKEMAAANGSTLKRLRGAHG